MAVRRRWGTETPPWAVAVAGVLLTGAAALHVQQTPVLYSSQTDVVFLTPVPATTNAFQVTQTDAIVVAGVIQREVAGRPATRSGLR